MILINILFGKSSIMKKNKENITKVDMDNCNYWRFDSSEWENLCINYLIENIIINLHKKDMIITCGGLPLPNHDIYYQLEQEYSIKFYHTLILEKESMINKLLENYKWGESNKEMYNSIIYT